MERSYEALTRQWIFGAVLALMASAGVSLAEETRVQEGTRVLIKFTITVPDENTIIPDNVAQYVPGQRQLIPALEQALMGMKRGEQKRVDLPPHEAFGPYDESKKTSLKREGLPRDVKTGTVLQTPEGRPFTIVELNDSTAVIDFNHPLAGKRLVFDVTVVNVQS